MDNSVRGWYVEAYPTDDLGKEIYEDTTFEDVLDMLNDGGDVYDTLGVADSIIRERIFEKLSDLLDVDYSVIYDKWLGF